MGCLTTRTVTGAVLPANIVPRREADVFEHPRATGHDAGRGNRYAQAIDTSREGAGRRVPRQGQLRDARRLATRRQDHAQQLAF